MNLQKLETVEIPLNKLALWDHNVRTSGAEDNLGELIASIRSVGLLQSLVVKKASRGTFVIGAGKRRFLALSQLLEQGDIKRSFAVPCRIAPDEADLTEISLAENIIRTDMSVFQEVSACRALVDAGNCVADIAARFGMGENIVNCRLALARVSRVMWKLYEEEDLSLGVLQAFTLTDDHATQERIWNDLPEWDRDKPNLIRRILLKEEIPATDKRVRFVGLDSYEAAGGFVGRDLFSEGEDGAYVADPELLTRLVNDKLQTLATAATAEGWKWVNVQPQIDHQALGKFRRIQPTPVPLPKKDAAKLEKLEAKQNKLQEQLETEPESDEEANALYDQLEAVEKDIEAIQAKQTATYDADTIAHCGTVVTIGHNGEAQLIYGLLSKEDAAQLAHGPEEAEDEPTGVDPIADQPPPAYSAVLVETLTTIKTAAIAAELSQQHNVALAGVVHALVLSQFGLDLHLYRSQSSIQINSTQPSLAEAAASKGVQALSEQKTAWLSRLPKTPNALWQWILAQPQDTLLALLAFCAALSLNGVKTKNDSGATRLHHADAVATALKMDMRHWFTPTADNFFNKVSKARILEAMTEAGKANSSAANLKKGPLAELAETTLAGTGWLPEPMRIAPEQPEDTSFALFEKEEEVTEEQP
jgi:ParB family chromosome partitioning protein